MISHAEVVRRSRRHNHDENVWVHPFSGRVSSWLTWVFINMGLSANQVTMLMFASGVGVAVSLLADSFAFAVLAFALFRLHVLLDVSDGEVARYRNQVSRFGVYWDQLIHIFTYPAILAGLALGRLFGEAELAVVGFAVVGMIAKGTDLGAKNVYYRVLYSSGEAPAESTEGAAPLSTSGAVRRVVGPVLHISGFDGLLFFYAAAYLIDGSAFGLEPRDWVVAAYSIIFTAVALGRVVVTARRDKLPMRRDFRP